MTGGIDGPFVTTAAFYDAIYAGRKDYAEEAGRLVEILRD